MFTKDTVMGQELLFGQVKSFNKKYFLIIFFLIIAGGAFLATQRGTSLQTDPDIRTEAIRVTQGKFPCSKDTPHQCREFHIKKYFNSPLNDRDKARGVVKLMCIEVEYDVKYSNYKYWKTESTGLAIWKFEDGSFESVANPMCF